MMDIAEELSHLNACDDRCRGRCDKCPNDTIREAVAEIQRLQKQCEGLANAATNNGQGLLIFERALERIKDLIDSEDGEPLDEAIDIATKALAFKAPEFKFGSPVNSSLPIRAEDKP